MEDSFPRVPKDLLEELERRYPDRCPDPKVTDRDLWRHVGAVELIRFLRRNHEHQISPRG